jgi:hypothetical protein
MLLGATHNFLIIGMVWVFVVHMLNGLSIFGSIASRLCFYEWRQIGSPLSRKDSIGTER